MIRFHPPLAAASQAPPSPSAFKLAAKLAIEPQ